MPAIFDHCRTVVPAEIDVLGHANNLAYLKWMVDAALAHSAEQGWPNDRYLKSGSGWVVRAHEIKYLRSAIEGDNLIVRTWIASWRSASSTRRYQILRANDELVLATAATEWAYVDFDRQRPIRVPPEVAEAFEVVGDELPT